MCRSSDIPARERLHAMYYALHKKQCLLAAGLLSLIAATISVSAQDHSAQDAAAEKSNPHVSTAAPIRIPNRPQTQVFVGQQGKQKTEIHFDPATGLVTLKLLVQDPKGHFIPNIRRNNFVVYENGVRQENASV